MLFLIYSRIYLLLWVFVCFPSYCQPFAPSTLLCIAYFAFLIPAYEPLSNLWPLPLSSLSPSPLSSRLPPPFSSPWPPLLSSLWPTPSSTARCLLVKCCFCFNLHFFLRAAVLKQSTFLLSVCVIFHHQSLLFCCLTLLILRFF